MEGLIGSLMNKMKSHVVETMQNLMGLSTCETYFINLFQYFDNLRFILFIIDVN